MLASFAACLCILGAVPAPRIRAVGIDLGTTNSAVCVYDRASCEPVLVRNRHGDALTPSVVSFLPDGQVLVGRDAIERAATNPLNTYRSIKRLLGRTLDSASERKLASQLLPSADTLRCDPDGGSLRLHCPALGRELRLEEVSAAVLGALVGDVLVHLRSAPADGDGADGGGGDWCADDLRCVITVPAQFEDSQREATEVAARLAGLRHVRLMREPVAAALAFGAMGRALDAQDGATVTESARKSAGKAEARNVLVVDIGAGTTDVSVLEVRDGIVEVLATAADGRLGGDDVDDALEAWLALRLQDAHPELARVLRSDPAARFATRRALEAAKVALSVRKQAVLALPLAVDGCAPSLERPALELTLTRVELDAAVEDVLARLKRPIYEAALNSRLTLQGERDGPGADARDGKRAKGARTGGGKKAPGGARSEPAPGDLARASDGLLEKSRALPSGRPLHALVMVGGVTHMLGVRRLAANLAGVEVRRTVDPMEAVARGAALQAAVTEGLATGVAVEDSWQAQLRKAYAKLELDLEARARRRAGGEAGGEEEAQGEETEWPEIADSDEEEGGGESGEVN
ncbi:Hsp70 protein-domain-containing protein [Pavlovales sp. CCMP2436]|nr:Hsp70 protein-domain-containing protein [Pavlovales sp. CCMP2436]